MGCQTVTALTPESAGQVSLPGVGSKQALKQREVGAAWFDSSHLQGKVAFATAAPCTAEPGLQFPEAGR